MYETNSVLRKTAETEISDLTFWLRFGSVRVFINRNRTEMRFPHIPNMHYSKMENYDECKTYNCCIVYIIIVVLLSPVRKLNK